MFNELVLEVLARICVFVCERILFMYVHVIHDATDTLEAIQHSLKFNSTSVHTRAGGSDTHTHTHTHTRGSLPGNIVLGMKSQNTT